MKEIQKVRVKQIDTLCALEKMPAPKIPAKWDFDKADKDFDKYIRNWRRLSGDVISALWIFYNKLAIPGKRTDLSPNGEGLPSWANWLISKGIGINTPTRHFQALGWLPSDSLVSKFTGNAENYTPEVIIQDVKGVLGSIDLDPASCDVAQQTVKAKHYYTEEDDGLTKMWKGCVFLNPPYNMPQIREFTDKLIAELPNIKDAILLTNDQTDTKWWQKCAINAQLICMPLGRISFYTPNGVRTSPTNGQTFFYYGNKVDKFRKVFSGKGLILKVLL